MAGIVLSGVLAHPAVLKSRILEVFSSGYGMFLVDRQQRIDQII
jgi:hypothetical protein